jgi:hypothetical protein
MPLLPFLSGAAGDPINLKRRVALQSTLGIPATSGFVDTRTNGGPFTINKAIVDRLAIVASGAPPTPLPAKALMQGGPFDMGDFDPADPGLLAMFANVYKRLDVTDNTTWHRWKFGLDGSLHSEAAYLTWLNDNDVLPRTRVNDVLLGGFTLNAEPGGNFQIEFPFVAGAYDFWGEPVQTVNSGSTLPILLRTAGENWFLDATDGDIFIRIETVGTDGTVTYKAKVTTAAAFGAFDSTYILGNSPGVILDSNTGLEIGTCRESPRIYWPAGATLADGGATGGDIFQIPKRRVAWTPSLATDHAIPAVNTRLYLNDEFIRAEGGYTLTAEWSTLEAQQDVSFEQGATVRRKGRFNVTLELTRELADLAIQKVLHEREEASVVIEVCSDDVIDATPNPDQRFRALFVMPAMAISGDMYGVESGGENTEETVTLTAGVPDSTYTFDGIGFDSHAHVLIDTDVADGDIGIL